MQGTIIAVGKIREHYLQSGIQEYLKRLRRYGRFALVEVREERFRDTQSARQKQQVVEKEGERLLQAMPTASYVVVLDRRGEMVSSTEWAERTRRLLQHHSHLVFVIGGPLGLSEAVRARAAWCLSFSELTFPHTLMRLVFLEQLYRVMTLLHNEKYHK